MDYELNDQDRADIVKNFFKKYTVWIIVALIVIAAGFGVNAYMQKRNAVINQNASNAFQTMVAAAQGGANVSQITESANDIISNYPNTVYAALANLTLANIAVQQGNLASAESILTATLQANRKTTLAPIIRLRLARVLIAENKSTEAIDLLQQPPKGFEAPYNLLTGDAELLQNNQSAAKASYLAAQQANSGDPLIGQLLTERLNSLGGNS